MSPEANTKALPHPSNWQTNRAACVFSCVASLLGRSNSRSQFGWGHRCCLLLCLWLSLFVKNETTRGWRNNAACPVRSILVVPRIHCSQGGGIGAACCGAFLMLKKETARAGKGKKTGPGYKLLPRERTKNTKFAVRLLLVGVEQSRRGDRGGMLLCL